uniref:Uncharacterized protein n=1 Tax=Zea mays TaxID=4577 RepID=C4J870_MAIZE|nr:unknown [Zea mays]
MCFFFFFLVFCFFCRVASHRMCLNLAGQGL